MSPPGPNRSKLQDMLANLRDAEELPPMQAAVTPPLRPSVPRISEPDAARPEDGSSAPAVLCAAAEPGSQTLWCLQSRWRSCRRQGSPSSWGGRMRRFPASWGWESWENWRG